MSGYVQLTKIQAEVDPTLDSESSSEFGPTDEWIANQVQTEKLKYKTRYYVAVSFAILCIIVAVLVWRATSLTYGNSPSVTGQSVKYAASSVTPCDAYNGAYFLATHSCCSRTCGNYCGAANCYLAPEGPLNCCTKKFVDTCGPGIHAPCRLSKSLTESAPASLCSPYSGLYYAPTQSCCHASCGAYCGATSCVAAPAGFKNCCTGNFTLLCAPGQKAPCRLLKKFDGTMQIYASNGMALVSQPETTNRVIKKALAGVLSVSQDQVEAYIIQSITEGVRFKSVPSDSMKRLLSSMTHVKANYEIKVTADSKITSSQIRQTSSDVWTNLQRGLDDAAIAVTVNHIEMPAPVEIGPSGDIVEIEPEGRTTTTAITTTTAGTTLPFVWTHRLSGVITIATSDVDMALHLARHSHLALMVAFSQMLGVGVDALHITGLGTDGNSVRAGFDIEVPRTVSPSKLESEADTLRDLLVKEFVRLSLKPDVTSVDIDMEQLLQPHPGPTGTTTVGSTTKGSPTTTVSLTTANPTEAGGTTKEPASTKDHENDRGSNRGSGREIDHQRHHFFEHEQTWSRATTTTIRKDSMTSSKIIAEPSKASTKPTLAKVATTTPATTIKATTTTPTTTTQTTTTTKKKTTKDVVADALDCFTGDCEKK